MTISIEDAIRDNQQLIIRSGVTPLSIAPVANHRGANEADFCLMSSRVGALRLDVEHIQNTETFKLSTRLANFNNDVEYIRFSDNEIAPNVQTHAYCIYGNTNPGVFSLIATNEEPPTYKIKEGNSYWAIQNNHIIRELNEASATKFTLEFRPKPEPMTLPKTGNSPAIIQPTVTEGTHWLSGVDGIEVEYQIDIQHSSSTTEPTEILFQIDQSKTGWTFCEKGDDLPGIVKNSDGQYKEFTQRKDGLLFKSDAIYIEDLFKEFSITDEGKRLTFYVQKATKFNHFPEFLFWAKHTDSNGTTYHCSPDPTFVARRRR